MASEMASMIRQKKAPLLQLSKKLCRFTLMEFHASPKKLLIYVPSKGYTQLPYAWKGQLRMRENRERGLRNGVNDKAKEGSTPTAVQKTLLIYTCGISCHSLKLCCFTFDGRTEVKAEREPRKES